MKDLVQAVRNRDGNTLARMAGDESQPVGKGVNEHVEKLVDTLFTYLKQLFPASVSTALKDAGDERAAKRQWVVAFVENGITSKAQLRAGMRHARASVSPFWPSPGQFIEWCNTHIAADLGLPSDAELYQSVMRFRAHRHEHDTAEAYPWSNNAEYWLVTAISAAMTARLLTESETLALCREQLKAIGKRISNGEEIPPPIVQIPEQYHPADSKTALSHIETMKAMLKRRSV